MKDGDVFEHARRKETLASGLTVVSASIPTAQSVSVGYWVRAGARDEAVEQHGLAHLLEHMAFKGTGLRDAAALARDIEDRGGYVNAHTGRENTAYYLRLMPEDLGFGVELLADLLTGATYPEQELAREKNVIVQEIGEDHDTPDDLVWDLFQGLAYPDHPLGRPILGTAESVAGFGRDDIKGFLECHYAADSIIVAAAGRLDHDDFLQRVERAFTGLAPKAATAPRQAPPWPGADDDRRVIRHRDLEQTHLVIGLKGVTSVGEEEAAQAVLSVLYGEGFSSRLFQEVREKRGLCYSVDSSYGAYVDCGQLTIDAATSARDAGEMVKLAGAELAAVASGATAEETARSRAQISASLRMRLDSVGSVFDSMPRQLMRYGRFVPLAERLELVAAVTETDVRRMAARLMEHPPVLAAVGPLKDTDLPDPAQLQQAFRA